MTTTNDWGGLKWGWEHENSYWGWYSVRNRFAGWHEVCIVDDFGWLRIMPDIPMVLYFYRLGAD